MTILLTGASGFIGSYLVQALEKQGIPVVQVDRAHGYDLSQPGWTAGLPGNMEIEVIFHLAQSRQYRNFPEGGMDILNINTMSTIELLEWARRQKSVRKFIFASTANVYGQCSSIGELLSETRQPAPDSMYAISKYTSELVIQQYREFFQVITCRLFSIYGPGQREMIIPNMIQRVLRQETVTLGQGKGLLLTPLYVEDCVSILNHLAADMTEDAPDVLNIAGDIILSLSEIVNEIANQLNVPACVVETEQKPISFCADITRLREGYSQPFIPFSQGIQSTLASGLSTHVLC